MKCSEFCKQCYSELPSAVNEVLQGRCCFPYTCKSSDWWTRLIRQTVCNRTLTVSSAQRQRLYLNSIVSFLSIPCLKDFHLCQLPCELSTSFYSKACNEVFFLTSVKVLPPSPTADAAAAKSHQSCPTLCDPIDSSPPGSTVPGILQARTLECLAISFSSAWKWKVKVK